MKEFLETDTDNSDLKSFTLQDSEDYLDEVSDLSPIYIEFDNTVSDSSENFDNVQCTSDEDEQNDAYVVIVSNGNNTKMNKSFHCEVCNLTFNNKEEVNNHLDSTRHESCKKCELCYNIVNENVYDAHMKLHKETFRQRRERNKVQCKTCYKFFTKSYLKIHIMKKHGSSQDKLARLIKCFICDKCVNYDYFSDHLKRIHNKATSNISSRITSKCPICDRLVNKDNLEKHISSHGNQTKQIPYVCETCGRVFKCSSHYHTHKLIHNGNFKYKCQFCPYQGLHLGLLKIHVRTHTKDYPYECSLCNKKFITKSNLSIHERRHNPPEFICSKCNKAFHTQRKLDKHFNLIHLCIRDVICDICGKGFGHKDGMYGHQKKVHNRLPQTNIGRIPSYLKQKQEMSTT